MKIAELLSLKVYSSTHSHKMFLWEVLPSKIKNQKEGFPTLTDRAPKMMMRDDF